MLALTMVPTHAATTKATPTPTAKASAKPSVSAKATAKPTATKKAVVKKKPRKKITITPSPKPKWPPSGFKANGGVYAKIPNAKELVGTASNSKILTAQLAQRLMVLQSVKSIHVARCRWPLWMAARGGK